MSVILVYTFITSQTVKSMFQKYLGLISDIKITLSDQINDIICKVLFVKNL